MKKIAYLFGAGASCHCMPIVSGIPERLDKLIEYLNKAELQLSETEKFEPPLSQDKTLRHFQIELIDDLRALAKLSRNHTSIDTAAKKLFIKGENRELLKLKLGLSVFLIAEQLQNPPDRRYDAFFAAIMGTAKHEFPQNLRIINWNYDFQFELAFMEYTDDQRIDACRSYLQGMSKMDYARDNNDMKRFGIFKLNGSPTLYSNGGYDSIDFIEAYDGILDLRKIKQLTKQYALGLYQSQILRPGISFAWERLRNEFNIVDKVINNVSDAEVLVVIGYSFPFFNRKIDREIIGKMPNLKKVYFQSPEAQNLIDRFYAISENAADMQLVPIGDLEQFYLPNEL